MMVNEPVSTKKECESSERMTAGLKSPRKLSALSAMGFYLCLAHSGSSLLKNKIQQSASEDLIGFLKQFMNPAASHLAIRRALREVVHVEGFYEKKGRAREQLTNEKTGLFSDQDFFFGGKEQQVFIMQIVPFSVGGVGGEGPCDRFSHWCGPENSRLVD